MFQYKPPKLKSRENTEKGIQNRISKGYETTHRQKKGTEEIFETIMTKNFPKLMSHTKLQIQEAQKTPAR